MTQPHARIIALVGLAGSGKSSAVEYLTEKGFPKVYFGYQSHIQYMDWQMHWKLEQLM